LPRERRLYLLRHAKSSWDDATLPDRDRPLAPRGRRAATRIAGYLAREGIDPELVLCSSAVRTVQTLELLRPALGSDGTVLVEDGLYAASSDRLLERVRRVPDAVASAMLVGHNPGLQRLALDLASGGADLERLERKFPTAALATLALTDRWSRLAPGHAELTEYVVPRDLDNDETEV
jgi:phosphohistidine phosphatase